MSASGSATLANTRLSLADGTAFADFSLAGLFSPYLNYRLTVFDSTGKKAIGYIKAAGTGETLGDEQLTQANAASDPNSNEANATTGWATTANNTLTSDSAAPQAGTYDLKNVATTAGAGMMRNDITLISGALYKSTFAAKAESGSFYWRLYNAARTGTFIASAGLHPATWTTYTYYACPDESTAAAWFYAVSAGGAATFHIDNHSFRQVLTPSATGVTITSTPGGTTYNWTSIEAGFNYNDASGYSYSIEVHSSGLRRRILRLRGR